MSFLSIFCEPDLPQQIFSKLSTKDLDNAKMVSKDWFKAIDALWKDKLRSWVLEHNVFLHWNINNADQGVSKKICEIIDPKLFEPQIKRHSCVIAQNQIKWKLKITVSEVFHEACSLGFVDVIKFLYDQEKNTLHEVSSKFGECGQLPLWTAAIEGHLNVVELLYDLNIKLFRENIYSNYKFKVEAKRRKYPWYFNPSKDERRIMNMREEFPNRVIKLLYGVGEHEKYPYGRYQLWTACHQADTKVVKQLCALGADVNKSNTRGKFALWIASAHGHMSVVKVLLNFGIIIDKVDKLGCSSMWIAAREGHSEIVKLLCNLGGDINKPNCCGQTPIWIAAKNGHSKVVNFLCEKGAEITQFEGSPCNTEPLWIALYQGHTNVIKILCQYGVKIHQTNWYTKSPMCFAKMGNKNISSLLYYKEMRNASSSSTLKKFPDFVETRKSQKRRVRNRRQLLHDKKLTCPNNSLE